MEVRVITRKINNDKPMARFDSEDVDYNISKIQEITRKWNISEVIDIVTRFS